MFNKSVYLLSIFFSFVLFFLICPVQVSAQTTVNFSLTILPAPEDKKEVIPEKVEKVEEKTPETKQIENTEKQEELLPNDNHPISGFRALLEKNSGIEKLPEVITNNKETNHIDQVETTPGLISENIRAGPT